MLRGEASQHGRHAALKSDLHASAAGGLPESTGSHVGSLHETEHDERMPCSLVVTPQQQSVTIRTLAGAEDRIAPAGHPAPR